MIWGCQWYAVCKFISTAKVNGETINLADPITYGNYSNSTVDPHGSKQVTGNSETWKVNNIYDIAGNCWEWTQEVNSIGRIIRGVGFTRASRDGAVTSRGHVQPSIGSYGDVSSRPTLYIK